MGSGLYTPLSSYQKLVQRKMCLRRGQEEREEASQSAEGVQMEDLLEVASAGLVSGPLAALLWGCGWGVEGYGDKFHAGKLILNMGCTIS